MASDQSSAATQAVRVNENLASQAYGKALPWMREQYSRVNADLAQGGEPAYLRDAFNAQRTGIVDTIARQGLLQQRTALGQQKGAALGGNLSASLTPQNVGAQIADQLYSSRLNEGLGRVEQMNKLIAMGLGQSAQTGNAALAAGQTQLQGIAGLPQYNSTYANVLGGLNLAGSLYGGYQQYQAGQPGLVPGATLPTSTNYSAFVGNGNG